MKKNNVKILLLSIIISLIIGVFIFPINVNAQTTDLTYTFDDNVIYQNDDIELQESFNLRYQGNYTKLYNASYSFTNDSIGNVPIGWTDVSGVDCLIQVNQSLQLHDNILELSDNSVANRANASSDFSNIVSGTIEFWILSDDTFKLHYIRITQAGTQIMVLRLFEDELSYHDGTSWNVLVSISDNKWYHIRVDFESGAGGYLGLGTDEQSIWINGEQEIVSDDFNTPATYLDGLNIVSDNVRTGYNAYLDGVGYSWLTNYTISTNLLPFLNVSETLQEIDRYEFAMSDIDTFHPTGADSTNGWSDIEVGGGDKVGIAIQGNVNGLIYSNTNTINDQRGTRKLNLGINGEFINVSVAIKPQVIDGVLNEIIIDIFDSDDIFITGLIINADLSVIVSTGSGNLNLNRDITLLRNYEFNFFINYELDRCFLIYIQDDIIQEIYDYTLVDDNKQGLDKIEVYSFNTDANTIEYFIDFIGIYNNGISILDDGVEFGLSTRLLDGVSNWNYEHNNLFSIIANGNFHLGAVDGGNYFRGSTLLEFRDTFNYTSTETKFLNIYDAFISVVSIPRLVFTLVSDLFNISYIKIDGVLLNESSNSYNLEFTHGNVDTNESYFYVNSDKLMFNHISNDTSLEFIQASFNINDISSDGYSTSFRNQISNNAFGFFRINFTDTSNLIQLRNIDNTIRYILSQNLTVRNFVVLITDRDDNSVSGLTTGFISEIKLLITENIGTSIITSALINMMIPIIMILIPTLALSNRYGKGLINPMFLLMSIICVVASLIPAWLFFIIAISNSLFIIMKRSENI